jgi:hypothetical protein
LQKGGAVFVMHFAQAGLKFRGFYADFYLLIPGKFAIFVF